MSKVNCLGSCDLMDFPEPEPSPLSRSKRVEASMSRGLRLRTVRNLRCRKSALAGKRKQDAVLLSCPGCQGSPSSRSWEREI